MSKLQFDAVLFQLDETDKFGSGVLLSLPESVSAQLPSRGMVMAEGTLNGFPLRTALEPDRSGSHWFKVDETLLKAVGAGAGDTVTLEIEATKEWPEPRIPADLQTALEGDPEAYTLWREITTMARWDWIRWISASKLAETRRRRVAHTCSKLKAGKRRPCCFNRNECTLTDA